MKNLIAFIFFLFPLFLNAQTTHTVAAKESLFSIGRLYKVHPRELAAYNNIPFETGLTLGQVLKIPTKTSMAPVTTPPPETVPARAEITKPASVKENATKTSSPIYHTVAKKEGLYGISKKYNTSIADIKKWNNLNSEALNEGMNLIVGYGNAASSSTPNAPIVEKKQEIVNTPEPVIKTVKKEIEQSKPPMKDIVKKGNADFNGGYFKDFYNRQMTGKHTTEDKGIAGIFKSTSGWDDGKYYCLHNAAPAGSYIRIINNATKKSVYAKVLDLIPDLNQNTGIVIRISNAAAAELGAGTADFECTLNF